MKGKVKKQKFCTGEGLAPAAPMSARLCALLRQPAANSNKIRVLFSASPAPPVSAGLGHYKPPNGGTKLLFC